MDIRREYCDSALCAVLRGVIRFAFYWCNRHMHSITGMKPTQPYRHGVLAASRGLPYAPYLILLLNRYGHKPIYELYLRGIRSMHNIMIARDPDAILCGVRRDLALESERDRNIVGEIGTSLTH